MDEGMLREYFQKYGKIELVEVISVMIAYYWYKIKHDEVQYKDFKLSNFILNFFRNLAIS